MSRFGPCLCGDTQCSSCGPAQGNFHCPICGGWADNGCEHISARTGKLKRWFQAEAEKRARAEAEAEARWYEEEQKMFDALTDSERCEMGLQPR